MKSFGNWDLKDLQELIADQVQESLTLDYKASAALVRTEGYKGELSKDVSAFANSAGGRIVFGITENGHLPGVIDAGLDPTIITREWIEQVINSNIQPRVQGVTIKQIDLGQGRVTYAIDIPQATTLAPHQARDHRYYKRFNFQSIAMEDYEVRDTLRRASSPELFLTLTPSTAYPVDGGRNAKIEVRIGNRSLEPALYSVINVYVDADIFVSGMADFEVMDHQATLAGVPVVLKRLRINHAVPNKMPLFKEMVFLLGSLTILADKERRLVGYQLACPGHGIEWWGLVWTDGNAVHLEELP